MADITWNGTDGVYGTPGNWIGNTLPGGSGNAHFGSTGSETVTNTSIVSVGAFEFDVSGYTIIMAGSFEFDFDGVGVAVNNGGATVEAINQAYIEFKNNSDGGTARYVIDTGGTINFANTAGPLGNNIVHVGSLEGDATGSIVLKNAAVWVGGNDLDTNYGGSIAYGLSRGLSHPTGSLVKVGNGTLSLSGLNRGVPITIASGTLELASAGSTGAPSVTFAPQAPSPPLATLAIDGPAIDNGHFTTPIDSVGQGDVLDFRSLQFVPDATAVTTTATDHGRLPDTLTVTNGSSTIMIDHLGALYTRFAALSDDNGGTDVAPAIIETRANKTVDGNHHPLGQTSPNAGPDVIVAYGANDRIEGLGGDDTLVARAPGVRLIGGAGADTFVFDALGASPSSEPDVVKDFHESQGDRIDLYGLFDDTHGHPLAFIGSKSFHHYHHTHPGVVGMVRNAGGELQINLDHQFKTEFAIVVHGHVSAGDLIL